MARTHAECQGHRSLGSKVRVVTDGRTDGGDCITSRADAVGRNIHHFSVPVPHHGCCHGVGVKPKITSP